MDEKETARLEAFSDGVFAVAITLLVLNIKIPGIESSSEKLLSDAEVWRALLAQWPMLVAYVTSFATIGIMWLNHHRLFVHIRRTDTTLMLLNLLLLLIIVFIPVPTALLSEYLTDTSQHAAAIVYTGTNFLMACCFNALWGYASYRGRLFGSKVDIHSATAISQQYFLGPLLYILIFALSFINVPLSILLCFILALYFAVPGRALRLRRDARASSHPERVHSEHVEKR